MKFKKNVSFLLGLTDSSSLRQRRYSSEDLDRTSSIIVKSNDRTNRLHSNQTIEELQQIIENQNKYIQQLQIRIRIHTPEVIYSSGTNRLVEENQVKPSKIISHQTIHLEFTSDGRTL